MARLIANTLVLRPGEFQPTPLSAGDEVPDWAVDLIGPHLLEGEASPAQVAVVDEAKGATPDGTWTVAELRDYAKENDVDLNGATSKAEILAAVRG